MAKGRKTGGRKKGTKNKRTVEIEKRKEGQLPLDYTWVSWGMRPRIRCDGMRWRSRRHHTFTQGVLLKIGKVRLCRRWYMYTRR